MKKKLLVGLIPVLVLVATAIVYTVAEVQFEEKTKAFVYELDGVESFDYASFSYNIFTQEVELIDVDVNLDGRGIVGADYVRFNVFDIWDEENIPVEGSLEIQNAYGRLIDTSKTDLPRALRLVSILEGLLFNISVESRYEDGALVSSFDMHIGQPVKSDTGVDEGVVTRFVSKYTTEILVDKAFLTNEPLETIEDMIDADIKLKVWRLMVEAPVLKEKLDSYNASAWGKGAELYRQHAANSINTYFAQAHEVLDPLFGGNADKARQAIIRFINTGERLVMEASPDTPWGLAEYLEQHTEFILQGGRNIQQIVSVIQKLNLRIHN